MQYNLKIWKLIKKWFFKVFKSYKCDKKLNLILFYDNIDKFDELTE